MYQNLVIKFSVALLAIVTYWLFITDVGSSVTSPALCCLWFVAGLMAMGRVQGLRIPQLVFAVLGAIITVGVCVYYVAATPPDFVGPVALIALFLIFAAQAVLSRRERLPEA